MRHFRIVGFVALAASSLLATAHPAAAEEINIQSPPYGIGVPDWDWAARLREAVAYLHERGGGTIFVPAGVYKLSTIDPLGSPGTPACVVINHPDISIRGESAGVPLFRGALGDGLNEVGTVFLVQAEGFAAGFKLRYESANLTGNRFENFKLTRRPESWGQGHGIVFASQTAAGDSIDGVQISNVTFAGHDIGILTEAAQGSQNFAKPRFLSIRNSRFLNNKTYGIWLKRANEVEFVGCVFDGTGFPDLCASNRFFGVAAFPACGTPIVECSVPADAIAGVYLGVFGQTGFGTVRISNCSFHNTKGTGFLAAGPGLAPGVDASKDLMIAACQFDNNAAGNLRCFNTVGVTISGSTITAADPNKFAPECVASRTAVLPGALIEGCHGITLASVQFSWNTGEGLRLNNCIGASVSGCSFLSNNHRQACQDMPPPLPFFAAGNYYALAINACQGVTGSALAFATSTTHGTATTTCVTQRWGILVSSNSTGVHLTGVSLADSGGIPFHSYCNVAGSGVCVVTPFVVNGNDPAQVVMPVKTSTCP